ncbi:MAG: biotin synthase BioB [Proteobacteria bacterium]|jgi:biotin synthase|nr:biotin synthase BioB [Pseudomonadota bacterium]
MTEQLLSVEATDLKTQIVDQAYTKAQITELFDLPFLELVFRAQSIHRQNFESTDIQLSTLMSVKTGACPEDCSYCPQSARYKTGLEVEQLKPVAEIIEAAKVAKANGASRFCMGAAWRSPKQKDIEHMVEAIEAVRAQGLETCATLGMLSAGQAADLGAAGLDYYNHNLDTSPEYYPEVISTRTYQDRLDTLDHVRDAGMKVCCGGIVGMGEGQVDRVGLLATLANMDPQPESVPINNLVKVEGTPLDQTEELDPLEFVRTIAVARILMPQARVRLSAGREEMSDEMQTLCFIAGANSIFYGEDLLTTGNATPEHDLALFERLKIKVSG